MYFIFADPTLLLRIWWPRIHISVRKPAVLIDVRGSVPPSRFRDNALNYAVADTFYIRANELFYNILSFDAVMLQV